MDVFLQLLLEIWRRGSSASARIECDAFSMIYLRNKCPVEPFALVYTNFVCGEKD